MKRTVWLAFGFLIVVGALTALKVGVAKPSNQQVSSFSDNVIGAIVSQDVLTKADRLDVSYVQDAPDKKIVPLKTTTDETERAPQKTITKIISRHWHEKYANMTKPSAPREGRHQA
jgi:hypothetical protein